MSGVTGVPNRALTTQSRSAWSAAVEDAFQAMIDDGTYLRILEKFGVAAQSIAS